jgi:hypothetical protein
MYLLGGVTTSSSSDSVLKFDRRQGTWCYVAPMPAEKWSAVACAVGTDIYVFGDFWR